MEDMAKYAERLIVLVNGEKYCDETPREVFSKFRELEGAGLTAPQMTYLAHALRDASCPVRTDILTIEEARREILSSLDRE